MIDVPQTGCCAHAHVAQPPSAVYRKISCGPQAPSPAIRRLLILLTVPICVAEVVLTPSVGGVEARAFSAHLESLPELVCPTTHVAVRDPSHPRDVPSWSEPRELQSVWQGFRAAEGSAPLHSRAIQHCLEACRSCRAAEPILRLASGQGPDKRALLIVFFGAKSIYRNSPA